MPPKKIQRIRRIEILANHPNNRHQDTLICYKASHNNGKELSFSIFIGNIIDVEEGR
jgi:hypothetical protein